MTCRTDTMHAFTTCATLPSFVTKDPISAESLSHSTVLIETDIFVGVSSPRCAAYQHTRLAIKKPDLAAARRSRSMQAGRGKAGRGGAPRRQQRLAQWCACGPTPRATCSRRLRRNQGGLECGGVAWLGREGRWHGGEGRSCRGPAKESTGAQDGRQGVSGVPAGSGELSPRTP